MAFYVGRVFVAVIVVAIAADLLQHHGILPTVDMTDAATDRAAPIAAKEATDPSATPPTTNSNVRRPVDYCNCPQDDVDANSGMVLAVVNRIVRSPYFRYFKVNTHKECPFWAVQLLCTSADSPCSLCTCDEADVPMDVRNEPGDMSDVASTTAAGADTSPTDDVTTGMTPVSIESWGFSMGHQKKMNREDSGDTAEQKLGENGGAAYVDLVLNPEGNTGYTGPIANKVWEAIYLENCMQDVPERLHVPADEAAQCSEFRVFYRLMSGFHSSIGINVATNFHRAGFEELIPSDRSSGIANNDGSERDGEDGQQQRRHRVPLYTPNCDMLRRMRSFQERRDNLNLLYQFTLRAVAKAAPLFLHDAASMYQSGNPIEDAALVRDLEALFATPLLCSATFDDVAFLESPYAQRLAPQMTRMMKNISTLMDCVACEKCRLWGKLETQGIAAAIKIVMAAAAGGGPDDAMKAQIHKKRSEDLDGRRGRSDDDGTQTAVVGHNCRLSENDIATTRGDPTTAEPVEARPSKGAAVNSLAGGAAPSSASQPPPPKVHLTRGEKIALMNLLRQLTVAVWSMNHNCL